MIINLLKKFSLLPVISIFTMLLLSANNGLANPIILSSSDTSAIRVLTWQPHNDFVLTVSAGGRMTTWDVIDPRENCHFLLENAEELTAIEPPDFSLSCSSPRIILGRSDGKVYSQSAINPRVKKKDESEDESEDKNEEIFATVDSTVTALADSPQGFIAACSQHGILFLRNSSGETRFVELDGAAHQLTWSPRCNFLAGILKHKMSQRDELFLCSLQNRDGNGSPQVKYLPQMGELRTITWFDKKEEQLICAFSSNELKIIDVRTQGYVRQVNVEDGNEVAPTVLKLSPDREFLAVGNSNGTVRVWNTSSWKTSLLHIEGHPAPITTLCWSPGRRFLVAGNQNGKIIAWSFSSGDLPPSNPPQLDEKENKNSPLQTVRKCLSRLSLRSSSPSVSRRSSSPSVSHRTSSSSVSRQSSSSSQSGKSSSSSSSPQSAGSSPSTLSFSSMDVSHTSSPSSSRSSSARTESHSTSPRDQDLLDMIGEVDELEEIPVEEKTQGTHRKKKKKEKGNCVVQ